MSFTCYYYWLFSPHRGGFTDSFDLTPAFTVDIAPDGIHEYSLALFCDQDGYPHFARLCIHGLTSKDIPDSILPLLQIIKEHLLSVLWVYDRDIKLARPGVVWNFVPNKEPPTMGLSIKEEGHSKFDANGIKNLFIHTMPIRESFRLYLDGANERIPLQYRFLSFYKLLELNFKDGNLWRHDSINKLLNSFQEDFVALGYNKEPIKVLHDIRDRCAHIKTGKNLGVTHLNHSAAVKVSELLPILRAICANVINQKAGGMFMIDNEIMTD